MSAQDLEQRARELLAAEYERDGRPSDADFVNLGLPVCDADIRALRAIVAALRQQPAPVDLEAAGWIHEDELPDSYPYDAMFPFSKVDVVRMFPVYMPTIQPAPAIIDNAGKPPVCGTCGGRGWVDEGHEEDDGRMVSAIEDCPECTHQPAPVVDDAMREDAERYRWLRDKGIEHDWTVCRYPIEGAGVYQQNRQSLDAAIDAARAQEVQS